MRNRVRDRLHGHEPLLLPLEGRMPAAVLLLLYEVRGEEHVLFQVRTQRVEHHKGEISLPGGGRDPGDESLLRTALRETHEEIGVAPEHIEIFGRLDDTPTISNFLMAPFVGAITEPGPYPFRHAPREVETLLEVPLGALVSGELREWTQRPGGVLMPAFRHHEHFIFGATARVIDAFARLLAADVPRAAGAPR